MEKRRFQRLDVRLGAQLELAHRDRRPGQRGLVPGELLSASPTGLGFQVGTPAAAPQAGSRIKVRFGLDGWEIELPARVIYTRGDAASQYIGLALELELATALNRQRYVEWIVAQLRPAPS